MYKGILESQEMMIIILVKLTIELEKALAQNDSRMGILLTRSSTETSIILWLKYAVRFLTTFTATTS